MRRATNHPAWQVHQVAPPQQPGVQWVTHTHVTTHTHMHTSPIKEHVAGAAVAQGLLQGSRKLAALVGSTMGPRGRNVAVVQNEQLPPLITNDGVTIARAVCFADPVENAAAQAIKGVAAQANAQAGDGTTTATVLAAALLEALQRCPEPAVQLQQDLRTGLAALTDALAQRAEPVGDRLPQVIALAAQNTDAAPVLAQLFTQLGPDAQVSITSGQQPGVHVEHRPGFALAGTPYAHFTMQTNPRLQTAALEGGVAVCIYPEELSRVDQVKPVMEMIVKELQCTQLFLVCRNVTGQALAVLAHNNIQGTFRTVAVRVQNNDVLADLAAYTGATLIGSTQGITGRDVLAKHMGQVQAVHSDRRNTTLVGPHPTFDMESYVADLHTQASDPTQSKGTADAIRRRAAALQGGLATIQVGAATEVEREDLRLRIEDAVNAAQAAQAEGVLPGGGATLAWLSYNLPKGIPDSVRAPLQHMLRAPLTQIAQNAAAAPADVLDVLAQPDTPFGFGYDASDRTFKDLTAANVLDPLVVTRSALEAAVSGAAALHTTDHVLYPAPDPQDN